MATLKLTVDGFAELIIGFLIFDYSVPECTMRKCSESLTFVVSISRYHFGAGTQACDCKRDGCGFDFNLWGMKYLMFICVEFRHSTRIA